MYTAQKYINGLKQAYYANDAKQQWDHFEKIIHGAGQQDLDKLRSIYPNIPNSLIQLLEFADGPIGGNMKIWLKWMKKS